MLEKIKRYQFLFTELVKRDFTKKYKRTMLGMAWSMRAGKAGGRCARRHSKRRADKAKNATPAHLCQL